MTQELEPVVRQEIERRRQDSWRSLSGQDYEQLLAAGIQAYVHCAEELFGRDYREFARVPNEGITAARVRAIGWAADEILLGHVADISNDEMYYRAHTDKPRAFTATFFVYNDVGEQAQKSLPVDVPQSFDDIDVGTVLLATYRKEAGITDQFTIADALQTLHL